MIEKIFLCYKVTDKKYIIFKKILVLVLNISVASSYYSHITHNTYL